MTDLAISMDAASPFDAIRRTRADGSEYWSARELMPLLGYEKWERFADAIDRATVSAGNSGVDVGQSFSRVREMVPQGGPSRVDYELSRFACYLTALNGDPRKSAIAAAQAYFVVKTREAETAPVPAALDSIITALAELAYREHVVPFAGRTLAFQRWRKPRKGVKAFVQLTIDLNLSSGDGTVSLAPSRTALKGGEIDA